MAQVPEPDVQAGIEYWNAVPATVDGVLGIAGGYGLGSLPRIDSLGSRQFLLYLIPELSTVQSAIKPLKPPKSTQRTRALDVGAGVGRVTADVLLHLVSDIVLVEPVTGFIQEAWARGSASAKPGPEPGVRWKGLLDASKSVTFLQGTLQTLDPCTPTLQAKCLGRLGYGTEVAIDPGDNDSGFDVIWCQWCLGHLSDFDLVAFLKRSHKALRRGQGSTEKSVIVVKENVCADLMDGSPRSVFDKEDSSLTRSDMAWKKIFKDAGLRLVKEMEQHGLPAGLYQVKA